MFGVTLYCYAQTHTKTHSAAQSHLCHVLGGKCWIHQPRKLLVPQHSVARLAAQGTKAGSTPAPLSQPVLEFCNLAHDCDFSWLNTVLSASISSATNPYCESHSELLLTFFAHVLGSRPYFKTQIILERINRRLKHIQCSCRNTLNPSLLGTYTIRRFESGHNTDLSETLSPTKGTL